MSEPKVPPQQPNPPPTVHPEAKPPAPGKGNVPDDSHSKVGLIGRPDQRGGDDKDGNEGLADPSPKP